MGRVLDIDLKRVEYPIEDTVRSVQESPLPDAAKDLLTEVLRHGGAKNNH